MHPLFKFRLPAIRKIQCVYIAKHRGGFIKTNPVFHQIRRQLFVIPFEIQYCSARHFWWAGGAHPTRLLAHFFRKIQRRRNSRNPSISNIVAIGQTKKSRSTKGSPQHILVPTIATNSNQEYPTMTRKSRRLTVVEMAFTKTVWVPADSTV